MPTVDQQSIQLLDELTSWRYLNLLESHLKNCRWIHVQDAALLQAVAEGSADLHVACRALERGCTPQLLFAIFA